MPHVQDFVVIDPIDVSYGTIKFLQLDAEIAYIFMPKSLAA